MSAHSTSPDGQKPSGHASPDGARPSTGRASAPAPQLLERAPAKAAHAGPPPSWQQLRTPPQGAAFAQIAPPNVPEPLLETDDATPPLFGGAFAAKEPPLRMRHLMALCGWALALTVLGLGVGIWAMVLLMSPGVPGWYEPVIVITGLVGVALAIASFITANKQYAPWALMGASTGVLFVAIGISSAVA